MEEVAALGGEGVGGGCWGWREELGLRGGGRVGVGEFGGHVVVGEVVVLFSFLLFGVGMQS